MEAKARVTCIELCYNKSLKMTPRYRNM